MCRKLTENPCKDGESSQNDQGFHEVGTCWNVAIHKVSCLLVLNAPLLCDDLSPRNNEFVRSDKTIIFPLLVRRCIHRGTDETLLFCGNWGVSSRVDRKAMATTLKSSFFPWWASHIGTCSTVYLCTWRVLSCQVDYPATGKQRSFWKGSPLIHFWSYRFLFSSFTREFFMLLIILLRSMGTTS